MKKLVLIFALTSLFCVAGFGQTKKTSWESNRLQGKVKEFKRATYSVAGNSGAVTKGKRLDDRHAVFNRKGSYVIITDHRFTDNKLRLTEILEYDDNDNCIASTYDADGNLLWKIIYRYDKGEQSSYDSKGNLNRKFVSTYDDKGNRIEESEFNADGNLNEKSVHKYDDNGHHIETILYDSEGHLEQKDIFKRDKEGTVEVSTYDADDNFLCKEIYKYDNKRCVENSHYDADGNLSYTLVYKYDDNGNMLEDSRYDGSRLFFKYDDKGNRVEERIHAPDGSLSKITVFRYNFDRKGNWVVKTTYENDIPTEVEERTIKYFGI